MKLLFRSYLPPEKKKARRKELLMSLLAGLLMGISFPPVPAPFIIFIALIPYFWVVEKRSGLAEINRFTYFTMFFFNITTLYWVGSWTKDADPYLLIAGTLLMFWNPILFLIPSTLYYLAKKYVNNKIALYLFPFFWIFYEFIYTVSDFRFPWLTLGNSLPYMNTFIQIADIIGVYGLSIIIIYANILTYQLIKHYRSNKKLSFKYSTILIILLVAPLIYGMIALSNYKTSDKKIKIGLIQPNLNPWKKWDAGSLNDQIKLYLSLSTEAVNEGAQIIVWPESALPVYLLSGSYQNEVNQITHFINENNVHLITGMPDATFYFNKKDAPEDAKPTESGRMVYTSYNSILYFSPNSDEVKKYGKIKLVPFGEKVPLVEQIPILGDLIKWNVGISSWNQGKSIVVDTVKVNSNSTAIGGVICIESIYPDFCAQFVEKGAEVLVVVTNDSWYGNSSGPYQHKEFAVLRAIENRRSVVRAANGGISCYINPLGETVVSTKMFTRDILTAEIELNNHETFYTKHPLFIPVISILISAIIILMSAYKKLKETITNKISI